MEKKLSILLTLIFLINLFPILPVQEQQIWANNLSAVNDDILEDHLDHVMSLDKQSGEVFSFGSNYIGQLGHGDNYYDRLIPTKIEGLYNKDVGD